MIDRLSPTRRPNQPACGYQQWRSLLFMHWPIPVDTLRPLVPSALELDLHAGVAYVGVVPFAMQRVRPRWSPSFLAFDFLETNVRTYVTHSDRPGVYFLSLDAASRLGVWIARTLWGLPYYYADMSLRQVADTVYYQSVRRGSRIRHQVVCRLGETLGPSQPDTIEFFFLERYLLFVERRGKIYTGQVHHSPYPTRQAEVLELQDDLLASAGCEYCDSLPAFTHYSSGVDVEIFKLQSE